MPKKDVRNGTLVQEISSIPLEFWHRLANEVCRLEAQRSLVAEVRMKLINSAQSGLACEAAGLHPSIGGLGCSLLHLRLLCVFLSKAPAHLQRSMLGILISASGSEATDLLCCWRGIPRTTSRSTSRDLNPLKALPHQLHIILSILFAACNTT